MLDALGLDATHKIQIHVGGVYGDKAASMASFAANDRRLPRQVRRRLAIENDDRLFSLADCVAIHEETAIAVVFDNLHHELNGGGLDFGGAFRAFAATWRPGRRAGAHTGQIDRGHFRGYLRETCGTDFDIMCEIKNNERSALIALGIAGEMARRRPALV